MSLKNTQIHAILLLWLSIVSFVSSIHTVSSISENNPSIYNAEKQELVELFEHWMKEHEKIYVQPEDKARAFKNFVKNFEYVREWNANKEKGSHVLGLNNFADLSMEEFNGRYWSNTLRKKRRQQLGNKMSMKRKQKSCNAPPSFDWRTHGVVSRVKDQGYICGSCWSFAATGAIEGINAIENGELISLSEQELIECVPNNGGCDGGYVENAFHWVAVNGGINSETNYPYTQKNAKCNITKAQNKMVKINGYRHVAPNDEALQCAVTRQPIAVSITTNSPNFFLYAEGIYDGNCSSNPADIDHGVLLVGYGSENGTDYWIVKNSWSTAWGHQGYINIRRDKSLPLGKCAIQADAVYPTMLRTHTSSSQISSFGGIFFLLVCNFISLLSLI